MNRKSLFNTLFWALTFGGLVAILVGEQRAVSLQIWLAALVLWFALMNLRRMLEGIPLLPARLRSLISFRRVSVTVDTTRLLELRSLEGLLLRATTNERAYAQQLHPQMVALADHFLPVAHGIDPAKHPERVHELFGPLSWLLEPDIRQRTPTLDELDQFVQVLVGSTSTHITEAA